MDTNENTTPGRASYTEEERRELIEEFQSSNLTQAAFCREWNLNSKTLARWLRIEREDNEVSFCEVELRREAVPADEVRVCLPNDSIGLGLWTCISIAKSEPVAWTKRWGKDNEYYNALGNFRGNINTAPPAK